MNLTLIWLNYVCFVLMIIWVWLVLLRVINNLGGMFVLWVCVLFWGLVLLFADWFDLFFDFGFIMIVFGFDWITDLFGFYCLGVLYVDLRLCFGCLMLCLWFCFIVLLGGLFVWVFVLCGSWLFLCFTLVCLCFSWLLAGECVYVFLGFVAL